MNEDFQNQTAISTRKGLSDNVASACAYITLVGIIFLFVEPYRSRGLVRFHCFQSIYLALLSFVISLLTHIPSLSTVMLILSLLLFLVWLTALIMALLGRKLSLPLIGPLAARSAGQ